MHRAASILAVPLAALVALAPLGIAPETTEQTASNPGVSVNTKSLFCLQSCNFLWSRTTQEPVSITVTDPQGGVIYSCWWEGPGAPDCEGAIEACTDFTSRLEAHEPTQVTTVTWQPSGSC